MWLFIILSCIRIQKFYGVYDGLLYLGIWHHNYTGSGQSYVALLGSEEGASSRLNLSQAFNSLGTTIAPIIGALFLLSDSVKSSEEIEQLSESAKANYYAAEAATVQVPLSVDRWFYCCIGNYFAFINLPKVVQQSPRGGYRVYSKTKG